MTEKYKLVFKLEQNFKLMSVYMALCGFIYLNTNSIVGDDWILLTCLFSMSFCFLYSNNIITRYIIHSKNRYVDLEKTLRKTDIYIWLGAAFFMYFISFKLYYDLIYIPFIILLGFEKLSFLAFYLLCVFSYSICISTLSYNTILYNLKNNIKHFMFILFVIHTIFIILILVKMYSNVAYLLLEYG